MDAVAVDWTMPMAMARDLVAEPVALQGNLDPLRLVVGGQALDEGVDAILAAMRGRAHIFNLGHGITPDTPVEHVEQLVGAGAQGGGVLMLWVKALHVISVIAWMAALLYLPRLLVYHAEQRRRLREVGDLQGHGAAPSARNRHAGDDGAPGFSGCGWSWLIRAWEDGWFLAKLSLRAGADGLSQCSRRAGCGPSPRTGTCARRTSTAPSTRFPTLLMVAIVILVIVKPF